MKNNIQNVIYGVAIGDAVGFPVQFFSREDVKSFEINDMVGQGINGKPEGTWSDDTSLTIAFADSLSKTEEIDYEDIMTNFVSWLLHGKFTMEKRAFDVGQTCMKAILRYNGFCPPLDCGCTGLDENGNGSLMRISPVIFYLTKKFGLNYLDSEELTDKAFEIVSNVSGLTHAHAISRLGCIIYCALLQGLLCGVKKEELRQKIFPVVKNYIARHSEYKKAAGYYKRLF